MRVSGDGLEVGDFGNIRVEFLYADTVVLQRAVEISGPLAVILRSDIQENVTFTESPGTLVTDLHSLQAMRLHGARLNNGTLKLTDVPNVQVDVVVPAFSGAGTVELPVRVDGAKPGDAFALGVTSGTLSPGTVLGAARATSNDDVAIPVLSVGAAPSRSVRLSVSVLAGAP
jgi:hypothetical protein